jgi:hypothetical protein
MILKLPQQQEKMPWQFWCKQVGKYKQVTLSELQIIVHLQQVGLHVNQ